MDIEVGMVELDVIIAVIGAFLAMVTFMIGRSTASKNDGKQDGQILTELGYLKSDTNEIKRRLDKADERDREYIGRLTKVEAMAASAHTRLDSICTSATIRRDTPAQQ